MVLPQTFKVFIHHENRTFTRCKLFEYSSHKYNRNSIFTSDIQNYSRKISFYLFQKYN